MTKFPTMTVYIDGKEVKAKVKENMGFQAGFYVKEVEYKGKLYVVAKRAGKWTNWTTMDMLQPMIEGYKGA